LTKQAQIIREIEQMIATGRIRPGQMLPTQKELMDQYGVAMGTIQQALGRLQSRGVLASTRGKGTVVRDSSALATAGILRPRIEMLLTLGRDTTDSVVSETILVLQQSLNNAGFDLVVRKTLPESAAELNRWAENTLAVVVTGELPPRVYQALMSRRKPIVIAGELYTEVRPAGVSQVTVAPDNIMQLGLVYLNCLGHRRITLCHGPDSIYYRSLINAFRRNAQGLGFEDQVDTLELPPQTDGVEVVDFWRSLPKKNRPTAIIVDGGHRACRVIFALQRHKIQVPEDVSVLAINAYEPHLLSLPALSRVESLTSLLGAKLAEVLLEVIQMPIAVREVITPALIRGETCLFGPYQG